MKHKEQGIAIVSVLILAAVLVVILTAYTTITVSELKTSKYSANAQQGFYAAEGGLNIRAEGVRAKFVGYLRPEGTSPNPTAPCLAGNNGSGDFACAPYAIGGRTVKTYVTDITKYALGQPETGTVAVPDVYAGLSYQQYAYQVRSESYKNNEKEASLYMNFQSRLVPLFQFAAFYQNDLEFHPGAQMTLSGRVHTNSNLYLSAAPSTTLTIGGKVTAGGNITRSRKDITDCDGIVRVDPLAPTLTAGVPPAGYGTLMNCDASNGNLSPTALNVFNKNVLSNQAAITVPPLGALSPLATTSDLWNKADLRIEARLVIPPVTVPPIALLTSASPNSAIITAVLSPPIFAYRVVDANRNDVPAATAYLNGSSCQGSASPPLSGNVIQDGREKRVLYLVRTDQKRLMDCIQANTGQLQSADGSTLKVTDTTGGGLAIHFSFRSLNSEEDAAINNVGPTPFPTTFTSPYGVEMTNGAALGTTSGTPSLLGLTVISNQQIYLRGNYNTINKVPASIMADAINVLSDNAAATLLQSPSIAPTAATNTTVNAAFLSGIDDTTGSTYNGGLQNYIRYHEKWTGVTSTYTGSFVSLGNSLHANGRQENGQNYYSPPIRAWNYDTSFNNANQLPPLTPRFVYLRQLLFARQW